MVDAGVRVGPTTRQATAEEERRLAEKRRWGDVSFDQREVPDASLDDLDLRRFQSEYLPSAVGPEVLERNDRNEAEQLSGLRLLGRNQGPTVTALLVLGKDPRRWFPGAYVQFVRYEGEELTAPIKDQKEISGPMGDQLRGLDEVFRAHISIAADLSGDREVRRADYPLVALQELARNAVIHRNYETSNSPVRISWFRDRIEIISPGGPYGLVSVENFGQAGITDYRNPTLAEAARNLGFAQRFGIGIARARRALNENGNPELQFDIVPEYVLVTVRPAR